MYSPERVVYPETGLGPILLNAFQWNWNVSLLPGLTELKYAIEPNQKSHVKLNTYVHYENQKGKLTLKTRCLLLGGFGSIAGLSSIPRGIRIMIRECPNTL